MSPPEPSPPPTPQEPPIWTEEEIEAILASADWYMMRAPRELFQPYRGMHLAILGEQIIDADRDFAELGRRLEAKGDALPMTRLLFRYVPTDEEAVRFRY